jgi:heme-degrading monooxygenase HmoA
MFARVATYDVPANQLDDAVRHFQEAIREITQIEGLAEAYVLVGRDDGRALTMTTWASQYALESSRDLASRLRRAAAKEVDGSVVSVAEYEVALHEVVAEGM